MSNGLQFILGILSCTRLVTTRFDGKTLLIYNLNLLNVIFAPIWSPCNFKSRRKGKIQSVKLTAIKHCTYKKIKVRLRLCLHQNLDLVRFRPSVYMGPFSNQSETDPNVSKSGAADLQVWFGIHTGLVPNSSV